MAKTAINNTEEYIEDSEQDIRGTDSDNLKTLSEQSDDIKTDTEEIKLHGATGSRWLGSTAGDSPGLLGSITPWVLVSNSTPNTYGDVKELFSGVEVYAYPFTPTKIHPHKLLVVTTSKNEILWKLQFANSGWDGSNHTYANMADAVAAGFYSTAMINFETKKTNTVSVDFQGGRMNIGSKVWCRCLNDDNTESTISIMIGIHAYLI